MSELTIGQMAGRAGVAVSALRYYESLGILAPNRTGGGQRRYPRSDLRKVSFLLAAQKFGYTLPQIAGMLTELPHGRAPNAADWRRISKSFRTDLDRRIAQLTKLRGNLDGCIGCGCLSLEKCALYNAQDEAGKTGTGPRFVLDAQPTPSEQPDDQEQAAAGRQTELRALGMVWRQGHLLLADIRAPSGQTTGLRPPGGLVTFAEESSSALRRAFREGLAVDIEIGSGPKVIEHRYIRDMQDQHEVLFIYDATLPDTALNGLEMVTYLEEDGMPGRARWVTPAALQRPGLALDPPALKRLLGGPRYTAW